MVVRYILPIALAFTSFASAVELRHITVRTGTDGLDRVPLTISNAGREALSCNADFAHWYSATIATAAPGKSASVELWFDPKTGTFAILNDKRENLPVERLWCGLASQAYATRVQIALDRTSAAKGQVAVTCSSADDRLACR
ncbi:MAG: hypothetical protein EOS23_24705 [Mesorhizobium sp.]|uniref:hypothetical protein n=1 Tax=Mesorhizobium sp. TaxID=1871066 RepID=UPI000FD55F67|nr:hypothetical protein [Mesorhizobium sp.]RUV60703.1 hypothetical protein EOA88_33380 [Mesorhizobium sp. M5C.F.Ca.IN.020.14.1.1]RWC42738.1 MAG: hypothetical protein EOS28_14785 [Mesorhizobium sp.]RWE08074.1 MAG: hypothetical protein EOS23_24705 [Mesorhizobium sp.]RWF03197.1 MAG: hypothetical protein EOS68_04680 [Mesorhizobium sp.]RWG45817.1 MAG: hypothetical protein EOQ62_16485 [Mesorhizobium sp.]